MNPIEFIKQTYQKRQINKRHLSLKALALEKASNLAEHGSTIRLDIGAGESPSKPGWQTLDRNPICDIYWDLVDGIPFADSKVTSIYASHVLEHIPVSGLITLLQECSDASNQMGIYLSAFQIQSFILKPI